ncbi:MAG: response regulator [Chloroflexi bacterium]|nr:response regulator [Chloroflexota bacterium]MDL1885995.1 response regulator [Anaerolineae bacterium CFX8]
MAVQPAETLLVSTNGDELIRSLNPSAYHIHTVGDVGKAMETLRDARYDIILLDDALFSSDIFDAVKEIKRRVPLIPVLVLSKNADAAYQTDLMEAGVDDFLTGDLSSEELQRRLRLILRQQRQARALAQRNQNLQSLTLLSRRMYSATDPHTLILDTIDKACATFKLYGVAIVLHEDNPFQLFAGREGCSADGSFFESILYLKDYDPFRRVIRSGFVQVFQNIVVDPNYMPIPALPAPESAIIVPLNYQEHKLGAMGVFGTGHLPVGHDDLLLYELFASQFAVALNNARHYHSQRISAQSSQHLLRAWQRFIGLQSYDEMAENLHRLVEEIPNVAQALVWMYPPDLSDTMTIVKTRQDETVRIFRQIEQDGVVNDLIGQLDERRLQPMMLQPGIGQKDPLGPLFKALRGQQLLLVAITDSARLIGGIIASVSNSRQYSSEDAQLLIASLAHATGLALERTTLIEITTQQSGRLEALLRSISEGIFFVDDTGHVAFCNPQFTEMTGIKPSEVLGYDSDTLLRDLARRSGDEERILNQLQEAVSRILSSDTQVNEDYPIVEITLDDPKRNIHVEFMMIAGVNGSRPGWAGVVRNNLRFKTMFGSQTLLLDMMSERIRVPYAQVRGLLTTLNEQHSRFTHRERARFLRQLEDSVQSLGHLWDNFLEMYNLEVSGLALSREQVDLYEIIQRVIDSRAFAEHRRQIQIKAPARLPLVEVDELRLELAISNVLHNAIQFSPKGSPVNVSLEHRDDELLIVIEDRGIGIPREQLERVFEPFFQAGNNPNEEGAGLGLYLVREIVQRHGGSIGIASEPGSGTVVTLALPVNLREESPRPIPQPPPAVTITGAAPPRRSEAPEMPERGFNGKRVSDRPPQTIMVVEGRSGLIPHLCKQLEAEGYEMIAYRSGEEALRDVNSIRLDLILLDVNLLDANGLDVCERMCKRTEVPIIMLADEASEAEKVRALMLGADDYIARPISDEELMARVNVIFKRRRIPDRTREPLDLGNLYIDFARREVFLNNKPLELTRIEYDLLNVLAVNQGQVLTHKQLLEKVWGPEYQAETQYLWVNVSRLRKKLEPAVDSPRYIHTQPGVGYVFRPS